MTTTLDIESAISKRAAALDAAALRKAYLDQDEFLVVDDFLSPEIMEQWEEQLEALKLHVHRNLPFPKHKKGGSVGYDTVSAKAPAMNAVYQSAGIIGIPEENHRFANAGVPLAPTCIVARSMTYTEEGDHIGWHYDTSYYKDTRWTLLVGFKDNSSSKLVGKLHTKNPGHEVINFSMKIAPGTLVLFNGDKVHHAVTPTKAGEERYMVSMQYVTNADMNPFMRFVSNMKDSIAYFGLKEVFLGRKRT